VSQKLSPVSRSEFIRRLRKLGFAGPFAGGKHGILKRGSYRFPIPNPHRAEIGTAKLAELLKEAGISREEWELNA